MSMHTDMLLTAALLGAAVVACSSPPTADKAIEKAGFIPITPPSALLVPGTIIKPFGKESRAVEGLIVCEAGSAVGGQKPLSSASESQQLAGQLGGAFTLSGNTIQQLKADAGLNAVEKVTVNFSNVKVLEMPADRVAAGTLDDNCRRALAAAGGKVTMVAEVLQADATYVVSFNQSANLDANAQALATKIAAAKLGASENDSSGTTISGQVLYWGVRLSEELVSLATSKKGGSNKDVPSKEPAQTAPRTTPRGY